MSGNKILSRIMNALGLGLVLLIILAVLPLSLPKAMGLQVYGVLSDSMKPAYETYGVVYVQPCDTATLQSGDVITFTLGSDTDKVMTHRIVGIDENGQFLTKGDANNAVDAGTVHPSRVVGKVVFYMPHLARLAMILETTAGIVGVIILFIVALILWMLSDIVKKSKRDMVRPFLRVVAILLMVGAAWYIGSSLFMYRDSDTEYEGLKQQVFAKAVSGGTDTQESVAKKDPICESVALLMEENEDTVGWIHFDNSKISYPIMQGEDNAFYLSHSFSKEEKKAGSIFMEAINHDTFEDAHTIIYGHNMRNLSMFGELRYYKDKDYYEGNEYFTIYTDTESFTYEIFACYDVPEYSEVYTVWYTADENFADSLQTMQKKAYYDTGVEVTKEDKVLTLFTCSTTGKRFVVHAKLVTQ